MKLSTGILAALATTGDAAITCDGTTQLFEVSCDATNGFSVVVNAACRNKYFTMVDFANSFLWKDSTVTSMAVPAGSAAADVVANAAACTSGGNPVSFKPASSGITDSQNAAAFGWTVPLSCAAATQNPSAGGANEYLTYDLYWNSQFTDGQDNMYQLGQVKFSCRIDPYQEDAGVVTITEDTAVTDPAQQYLNIAASIDLKVNKAVFDGGSPQDEATFASGSPVLVDSGANTPVYGQAITYAAANAATLGDYMELKLEPVGASTVLTDFAVSLTKCWASRQALPATDDTNANSATQTGTNYYPDTSNAAGAADEFVFFDDFCPLYPSWVGPNPVGTGGYLNEEWGGASSLHAVHFRQFGFNADQAAYATNTGASIYYHCFVKICDKSTAATCSTTTLTGATTSCSATKFAAPTRRRRDLIKREAEEEATQLDAPEVSIQGDCEGDAVCVNEVAEEAAQEAVEEAAGEDVADAVNDVVEEVVEAVEEAVEQAIEQEVESGVAQTTLTLAAVTLALLN